MLSKKMTRSSPRERPRQLAFDAIQILSLEPPYPLEEVRNVPEQVDSAAADATDLGLPEPTPPATATRGEAGR